MTVPLDLIFLGDLMIGRRVSSKLVRHEPAWFWGDVLPVLRSADAVFGNLETSITTRRVPFYTKAYHFRADPAATAILTAGGVRFVAQANNHSLDYGPEGLADTIAALDGAGIIHAGAGATLAEASAPVTVEVKGERIGFLSATDTMADFAATAMKPGTHVLDFTTPEALAFVRAGVAALKAKGAGLIVLTLHWGPNMRQSKPDAFRRFAHAAIDAGIDILHGHSAHLTQGVERHCDGLILYDTGNFIGDYIKFPFLPDDCSFVFRVTRDAAGRLGLRLSPVALPPLPPRLMRGREGDKRRRKMCEQTAALGSRLTQDGDDLVLD